MLYVPHEEPTVVKDLLETPPSPCSPALPIEPQPSLQTRIDQKITRAGRTKLKAGSTAVKPKKKVTKPRATETVAVSVDPLFSSLEKHEDAVINQKLESMLRETRKKLTKYADD